MKNVSIVFFILEALLLRSAVSLRDELSSHNAGLEEEHQHTKRSQWDVTSNDEKILAKILRILNPQGADVQWGWRDEYASWTFGLVQLTAQDAKGALALHMLHRHGLAPLVASRAGTRFVTSFEGKLQSKGNPGGNEKAKLLVEAQEEFDEVQTLRALLNDLTLSGLRNLHSYDHAWSVRKGANVVKDCSHSNPGACALQACYSPIARDFMQQNGFTPDVASSLHSKAFKVMVYIFNPVGYWHLGAGNRNALATPSNTGDITVTDWEVKGSTNWFKALVKGGKRVAVNVRWEGGAETSLDIPISVEMKDKLQGAMSDPEKSALLEELVNTHITKKLEDHKKYMHDNRLTIWAGEEAEFTKISAGL